MRKRSFLFVLFLMFTLTMLIACSGQTSTNGNEEGSSDGNEEGQYKIGVAAQGLSHEFIKALVESMEEKAEELNVDLIVMDSEDQIEKQLNQVDSLISQ